jgi:hypothetical protein
MAEAAAHQDDRAKGSACGSQDTEVRMRFPISICLALPGIVLLANTAFAESSTEGGPLIGRGVTNERVEYIGDIDGTLLIQMTLCPDETGQSATGTYFYQKYLKDIRITSEIKDGTIVIREFDPRGKATGLFTGTFPAADPRHQYAEGAKLHGEVISGTWSKPDGTASRPFYLRLAFSTIAGSSGAAYEVAGFSSDAPVDAFASRFREAVLAHDAKTVAASFHYPISIAHQRFHSPKELAQRFDGVFTPLLLQRLSRANPIHMFARDQGVMMGDGEVWIAPDKNGRPFVETINTDWEPELIAVDEPQAAGDGITISGVHIAASRPEEGGERYQLTSAGKTVRFENQRSATVYVEAPRAGWLLIQDAFVSNEDRILIYDSAHLNLPPQVLAHDDTADDYQHCHYEIGKLTGGAVKLTENEWAGSKPPRSRTLTLRHAATGISLISDAWIQSAQ